MSDDQNKKDPNQNQDPKANPDKGGEPKPKSKDDNMAAMRESLAKKDAEIRKLTSKFENLEREKKEAEKAEQAEKGEFEKLYNEQKAENEKLRSDMNQTRQSNVIRQKLIDSGVQNKFLKTLELQLASEGVKINDDGELENFDTVTEKLKKDMPEFFANVKSGGSVGTTGAGASQRANGDEGTKTYLASELNSMTEDQYAAQTESIDKAMAEGRVDWSK